MTSKGVLIECYGLPGAGKTTLSDELSNRAGCLTTRDVGGRWRQLPWTAKLRFGIGTLFEVRVWSRVAAATLTMGIWKSPDGIRRMATLPFLRARAMRLLGHSTLALDQWLIQEVWSALVSAGNLRPETARIAALLRALYRGVDVQLLCLEVEPALAAGRVADRSRGSSRFDPLTRETIAGKLEPAGQLVGIISEAAAMSGLRVRRLEGRRDPVDLVEDAIAALGISGSA